MRPSSDVALLPCRTKLQSGASVARQEINSDSGPVDRKISGAMLQGVSVPKLA